MSLSGAANLSTWRRKGATVIRRLYYCVLFSRTVSYNGHSDRNLENLNRLHTIRIQNKHEPSPVLRWSEIYLSLNFTLRLLNYYIIQVSYWRRQC